MEKQSTSTYPRNESFLQVLRNETITNKQIIEELRQKNWFIECKTELEVYLVLQARDNAKIRGLDSVKVTEYNPFILQ